MKTLIVYGTKYGTTEKCAKILADKLTGKVDLIDLKKDKNINIKEYSKVIIGGSVYMSKVQKEVTQFCNNNINELQDKKVGLFICCMRDGEIAEKELRDSFPEELIDKAIIKGYFGGEFIFKKMNFMDKLIVKKVSKIDKDTSNIMEGNINKFAEVMNNA